MHKGGEPHIHKHIKKHTEANNHDAMQIMKPPADTQLSKPPSRDQIAQRLAAGKAKPKEGRSSQQDIQAKVMHHAFDFIFCITCIL